MDRWECTVCGYVYDQELGDPMRGVLPGTAFQGLLENWSCPVCGAPKVQFNKRR